MTPVVFFIQWLPTIEYRLNSTGNSVQKLMASPTKSKIKFGCCHGHLHGKLQCTSYAAYVATTNSSTAAARSSAGLTTSSESVPPKYQPTTIVGCNTNWQKTSSFSRPRSIHGPMYLAEERPRSHRSSRSRNVPGVRLPKFHGRGC
jgi:hypothetical protein